MEAAAVPARALEGGRRGPSPALLRLASDAQLVSLVRAGRQSAFEALYARHQRAILVFCSQLLGDRHEAEDAVQHTFLSAYNGLRSSQQPIQLRPWLFAIARNRCYTLMRARREVSVAEPDGGVAEGPATLVQRREDLRHLVEDVSRLPEDQRTALVMAELGAVSHDEIAVALDVPREKVKALVFQARESLNATRRARDTDCADIRYELRTLRGPALRRGHLRRHLHECAGCREYRRQLGRQRPRVAAVLPLAPLALLRQLAVRGGDGRALAPAGGGGAAVASAVKLGAAKPVAGALAAALSAASAVVVVHTVTPPPRSQHPQPRALAEPAPPPAHHAVLRHIAATEHAARRSHHPATATLLAGRAHLVLLVRPVHEFRAWPVHRIATTTPRPQRTQPPVAPPRAVLPKPSPVPGEQRPSGPSATIAAPARPAARRAGEPRPVSSEPGRRARTGGDEGGDPGKPSGEPGGPRKLGGPREPGATDPGRTDPGTTAPGTSDPRPTDPRPTDPGSADPGSPDPARPTPREPPTSSSVVLTVSNRAPARYRAPTMFTRRTARWPKLSGQSPATSSPSRAVRAASAVPPQPR